MKMKLRNDKIPVISPFRSYGIYNHYGSSMINRGEIPKNFGFISHVTKSGLIVVISKYHIEGRKIYFKDFTNKRW